MTIECKNCSMHEQCICEASADECEIRKQSYNKAIDDFVSRLETVSFTKTQWDLIKTIAEQLKAGEENA